VLGGYLFVTLGNGHNFKADLLLGVGALHSYMDIRLLKTVSLRVESLYLLFYSPTPRAISPCDLNCIKRLVGRGLTLFSSTLG
jgi:hypothetical protein